ncbi:MAG: hypothetical protein ICV68_02320 [Pyrinomonadaceae bacterium]|nr:hypothetical protein [Pyrinomonadaceae bacterium]
MYKPIFCADCGERIERDKWRLWTSRRFCEICEKRLHRPLAYIIAVLATFSVLVITVLTSFRAGQATKAPVIIERDRISLAQSQNQKGVSTENREASTDRDEENSRRPAATA